MGHSREIPLENILDEINVGDFVLYYRKCNVFFIVEEVGENEIWDYAIREIAENEILYVHKEEIEKVDVSENLRKELLREDVRLKKKASLRGNMYE